MSEVPEISVEALAKALALPPAERPALVDVRQPWEHALAALPGALLLPLHRLEEELESAPLLASLTARPVVVYCHHGVRSLTGAAHLRSLGVDARSLEGGIDRWSAEIDKTVPRY